MVFTSIEIHPPALVCNLWLQHEKVYPGTRNVPLHHCPYARPYSLYYSPLSSFTACARLSGPPTFPGNTIYGTPSNLDCGPLSNLQTGTPGKSCPNTCARAAPRPFCATSWLVIPPLAMIKRGRLFTRWRAAIRACDTLFPISRFSARFALVTSLRLV